MDAFFEFFDFSGHALLLGLPAIPDLIHDDPLFLIDLFSSSPISFEMIPLRFPGFTDQLVLLHEALDHVH